VSKYYFKVSASGTLLSTSSTIPAELANTGIDSTNGIMFLLGGLSLALIGAEMIMIARRKRSN
jgi:LPXTG-motif cell wall-anchored protein